MGDGKTCLLLDCGIPIKRISEGCNYSLSSISGVLVTHIHSDHSRAINDLIRRGIPVYAPVSVRRINDKIQAINEREGIKRGVYHIDIGTFKIIAFKVEHDCECMGFYIYSKASKESLVYMTDLAFIPYRFTGVTYWLVEANYSLDILDENVENGADPEYANRVINSHMSIEKLEAYFRGYDVLKSTLIVLIHLSDGNSDAADFTRRIERITGVPVITA